MSQLLAIRKESCLERQMAKQRSETQGLGGGRRPTKVEGEGERRMLGVSQKGVASTGGEAKSRDLKLDAPSLGLSKKPTKEPQKRKMQQLCSSYKRLDVTRQLHQLRGMCSPFSHLGSGLDSRPWRGLRQEVVAEEEPDFKLQGERGRAQMITGYKSGVFILFKRWNF